MNTVPSAPPRVGQPTRQWRGVIEEYRVTRDGIWRRGREDEERRLSDFSAYIERKDIDDDGDHGQQRDAQELLDSQRYHLVIQQGDRPLARHVVTAF